MGVYCLLALNLAWWKVDCTLPTLYECVTTLQRLEIALQKDFPVLSPRFRCVQKDVYDFLTK